MGRTVLIVGGGGREHALALGLVESPSVDSVHVATQGSFSGRATAINENGERNAASRQGVWERKGNILHFYSLDDVTDGNFYLCITEMNLTTDKLDMKFYSVK